MKTQLTHVARFAADDKGGAAIEVGILAAAIGLAIVQVVAAQPGGQLGGILQRVVANISGR